LGAIGKWRFARSYLVGSLPNPRTSVLGELAPVGNGAPHTQLWLALREAAFWRRGATRRSLPKWETHCDNEMFYFRSGVALMLFVEAKDGHADLNNVQMVRIQPGTQVVITVGKAHFVPVAEDSKHVVIVVVSPKMDVPRVALAEAVEGIK
jgi:hypothetical protein